MAEEVKRVSFTTIVASDAATGFGSGATSGGFSSSSTSLGGQKAQSSTTAKSSTASPQKKSKTSRPSIRIEVKLFEPNADSFPEYNFRQLMNAEKKKLKHNKEKSKNGFLGPDHFDDPLGGGGDDDDDVARLAKELEAKYGSGSAYSKSTGGNKRGTVDHFDKGAGYDENDSFIDNTEAYDELIPDEIEPNHGGFYINSGLLQFHNRPNYERPEDALRMPKARKRTLSTSSEDDEEEQAKQKHKKEKKKRQKSPQPGVVNGNATPSSNSDVPDNQQSKNNGQAEKRVKVDKDGKVKVKKSRVEKEAKKDITPVVAPDDGDKPVKTITVKDMLRLNRDNHRNKQDSVSPTATPQFQSNTVISSSSSSSDSDSGSDVVATSMEPTAAAASTDPAPPSTGHPVTGDTHKNSTNKLPVNNGKPRQNGTSVKLPDNVAMELMKYLIMNEQTPSTEHILSRPAFLEILLKVEQLTRSIGQDRQQIYAYLEDKVKCPRADLMAKAERLYGQSEEGRSRKLMQKLKKVIETKMAKLLETYDAECRRVAEMKSTMHVIGFISENQIPVQLPRRKFVWTESSRKLLIELLMVVKSNYVEGFVNSLPGKGRSQSVEVHLEDFLKQELLPMWPTGWMTYEALAKEVDRRIAHTQKQMVMKDLVSNDAALLEKSASPMKKESLMAATTTSNGAWTTSGGGVIITPVPKGTENSSSKTTSNGGRESSSAGDVKLEKHQQPPKKNYDYSITSLIGPSSNTQMSSDAKSSGTGSLKVKSVAALNNASPSVPKTVIVACTDEEDEADVQPKERRDLDHRSGVSGSGSKPMVNVTAAPVRSKRTSDSDSSCEIVNVYSSTSSKLPGGGDIKPDPFKNGGGSGNSKDSIGKKNSRGMESSAQAPVPLEANDIDVNQIMQDLKERT